MSTHLDPSAPHTYPKRIVLAVTGLSPQVVTETLYALAVSQSPPFVPTEVHLITTSDGAERARLTLLSRDPGWFHRLCREYRLTGIDFRSDNIHALRDHAGAVLTDIRTPADNDHAADFITERVRLLTRDDAAALHVSIAGGRKTMGFYLGYALSLYGRAQDRLSHVLVSAPFESHPDFFYPTRRSRVIYANDKTQTPLDTRNAVVTLAEIPFVRLREGVADELLQSTARFSDVVADAQKAVPPVALALDPATQSITAGGETIRFKPADFAFYWMFSERCRDGRPGIHWSEDDLPDELLDKYGRIVNRYSGDYERAEVAFTRGFTKDNFDPRKAHVNKAIKRVLGRRRAQPYLIVPVERIPDSRYRRNGLTLPAEAITIRPCKGTS